jgi:uncharacterized membrane protein
MFDVSAVNNIRSEQCHLLRCDAVTLVITDVSEELIASIIMLKRIGEIRNTLAVPNKLAKVILNSLIFTS